MRGRMPGVTDTTSSRKLSFLDLRSKVQRRICEGSRSPLEVGSSIVIFEPRSVTRSVAFRKCSVLREGPLNQRTSLASPFRGSTPTMVGRSPFHSHIGSPDFRRSRLVVRAITGMTMYFWVMAMSWMIPRYGDFSHHSFVISPLRIDGVDRDVRREIALGLIAVGNHLARHRIDLRMRRHGRRRVLAVEVPRAERFQRVRIDRVGQRVFA